MVVKLSSINLSKNRKRFYVIADLQLGLWGEYILELQWGRIGSKSRTKTLYFKNEEEMKRKMRDILRLRELHGYVEVDDFNEFLREEIGKREDK